MPDAKTAVLPRKDGLSRSADGRNLGRQRSEIYTSIHVNHGFFLPPTANSCERPGTARKRLLGESFPKRSLTRDPNDRCGNARHRSLQAPPGENAPAYGGFRRPDKDFGCSRGRRGESRLGSGECLEGLSAT